MIEVAQMSLLKGRLRRGSSPTGEEVAARIRREARIVGLRDIELPSLEAVERRRVQLWMLTVVLLGALASLTGHTPALLNPNVMRIGIIVLTFGYCAYALEQEVHLRKLTRLLLDERLVTVALTNRVHELASMLQAGRAVNSVLQLDSVL